MAEAYPLEWPAGRPRAKHAKMSRFQRAGLDQVRAELYDELRLLGARQIVISTNRPTRLDGEFYASSKEPVDSGVAVYFQRKGQQLCFACDKWDRMWENVRAITLTINAIRGMERWGVGEAIERAFMGFQALPAPISGEAPWYEVLGVAVKATEEEIREARVRLAKRFHPDTGSLEASHKRMAAVNKAANTGISLRRAGR